MSEQQKKGLWDKLSPKTKRILSILIAVFIIILISAIIAPNNKTISRKNEVSHVLTDVKNKEIGLDTIMAQMKITNDQLNKLQMDLTKISKEQELARSENAENKKAISRVSSLEKKFNKTTQDLTLQIESLNQTITKTAETNAALRKLIDGESLDSLINEKTESLSNDEATQDTTNQENGKDNKNHKMSYSELKEKYQREKQPFIDRSVDLSDPNKLFAEAPIPNLPIANNSDTASTNSDEASTSIPLIKTNFITENKAKTKAELEAEKANLESTYIPPATIIKGVLLSGLDAPTNTKAMKDPMPVVVRIKTEGILANHHRIDLKECMLTMSGYGDMSSERAYLRGEDLTCVRDDGAILKTKLPSAATGEDGKAGLRGRVVSKTGALLSKALLAGFVEGVSQAFDVSITPTINTSSDGTVSYEEVYSPKAFQGAAVSGVSTALERLANYYMDLAENIFPVIEVDAGREVTLITTSDSFLRVIRDQKGNDTTKPQIIKEE